MNRRQFILSSTAFALGVAFARMSRATAVSPGLPQAPAQPAAPPVTRFEELRRGVGMFIGTGGTIGYLVNADGAIAVDSQFMNTAEICAAGLKQRAPKGIAMLLNTHHHGDHTGGNKAYGVSKIVAHDNCLKSHTTVTDRGEDRRPAGLCDRDVHRHVDREVRQRNHRDAVTSVPATPAAMR